MGTTISPARPIAGPRTVTYTAANGVSITLDYCNYTLSVSQQETSRGVLKRIYRFSFTFVAAYTSNTTPMSGLADIQTEIERTLMQRCGTLSITDGQQEIYRCGPAGQSTIGSAGSGIVDKSIRPTILADIGWGPKPVSISLQPIGVGIYGQWVLDVEVGSEDAFVVGDLIIVGCDSEVTYAIDQNHYTTRTVVGRLYCANWGRNGADPFFKQPLSQTDQNNIRLALLGTNFPGLSKNFMQPILIPPNFMRVAENFSVDATENTLGFVIIDKEKYRMMPTYITDAGCQVVFTMDAASQASYCRHTITGYCEGPRDVDKGRILQACIEQIQDAMGPLLFREASGRKAFVYSSSFTNDCYANRIAYQLLVLTPYGNFNVLNSLGIANFRSSVFLPQGVGGSAQLFGSGYRLNPLGNARDDPNPGEDGPGTKEGQTQEGLSEEVGQAYRDGRDGTSAFSPNGGTVLNDRVIAHQATVKVHQITGNCLAIPASSGALAIPYAKYESCFTYIVEIHVTEIDTGSGNVDYLSRANNVIKSIPGLFIIKSQTIYGKFLSSTMGKTKLVKYALISEIGVSEQLRKNIINVFGIEAFVQTLEQSIYEGNNNLFYQKFGLFLKAGTSGSPGG